MAQWEVVADHSGATASDSHGLPSAPIRQCQVYSSGSQALLHPGTGSQGPAMGMNHCGQLDIAMQRAAGQGLPHRNDGRLEAAPPRWEHPSGISSGVGTQVPKRECRVGRRGLGERPWIGGARCATDNRRAFALPSEQGLDGMAVSDTFIAFDIDMRDRRPPGLSRGKTVQVRRGAAAVTGNETRRMPLPSGREGAGTRSIRKPEDLSVSRDRVLPRGREVVDSAQASEVRGVHARLPPPLLWDDPSTHAGCSSGRRSRGQHMVIL